MLSQICEVVENWPVDDKSQLEILLRASGFRIVRERKHQIWKREDGKIWVVPRTPSDRHAYKNALGHFRSFLAGRRFAAIHQPVPRIAAKPKVATTHPRPVVSEKHSCRQRVTQAKAQAVHNHPPNPQLELVHLEITAEHIYKFGSLFSRGLQEHFVRPRIAALAEDWYQELNALVSRAEIEKWPELRMIRNLEIKLASFTVALFQRALRELARNGKVRRSALHEKLKVQHKKLFPSEGREMRAVSRWLIHNGFMAISQFLSCCATDAGIPVLVANGGEFVLQFVREKK